MNIVQGAHSDISTIQNGRQWLLYNIKIYLTISGEFLFGTFASRDNTLKIKLVCYSLFTCINLLAVPYLPS